MEAFFLFLVLLQPGMREDYTLDRSNSMRGITSGIARTDVLEVEPHEVVMRNRVQLRTLIGQRNTDEIYRFDRYYFRQQFLDELRQKGRLDLTFASAEHLSFQSGCHRIKLYDFSEPPEDVEGFQLTQRICPSEGGIRGVVWYMIEGVRNGTAFKLAFNRNRS